VSPAVVGDWGWWRVTVAGTDVSMFRDTPVSASWQDVEPWGSDQATLTIPAITPLDTPGAGALAWLVRGAPVDIWRLQPDGDQVSVWSGEVSGRTPTISPDQGRLGVRCTGDMEAASLQNWQPPPGMDPTDIGHVIADALNAVLGRRYKKLTRVTTGILTTYRGSDDQSVLAYCQELLSTAVTDAGINQWTVRRQGQREYVIALKSISAVHYTVRAGQPGVELDLSVDDTTAPTRIFGSGVTKDGYSWKNMFYPSAFQNTGATYPYTDVGNVMSLGTTDADTDTGSGVSDLQNRINELGLSSDVRVDGVLNANDVAAIKVVQKELGLLVDGVVGGQTWSAFFDIGNGSLGDAIRLPLAVIDGGQARFTRADGSDGGPNPDFDVNTLVVDRDVNFGGGVSKTEGRRAARAMLARDYPAGLTGRITLKVDPQEASRFDVAAGRNIVVEGISGADKRLHIASVQGSTDGAMQLAVDEKSRDLISLVEIMQRNRANAVNPAGLPKNRFARRALLSGDTTTPFDGESPAGRIPTVPLYANLWTCIWVPFSPAGRLAKIELRTSPATKYALAFFGQYMEPANLNALVGNPLTQEAPWTDHDEELRDHAWIEGWGSSLDGPGLNAKGEVIALWRDEGSLEYRSERPPLVRVCFYSPIPTRISGRVYPAPLDA
jgi:peptidoglycan hydrolase-like protein with peptidoglycan-binding domain